MKEKPVGRVYVDMGEMVEYIFEKMIESGFAPNQEGIYEVLMLQDDYITEKIFEANGITDMELEEDDYDSI